MFTVDPAASTPVYEQLVECVLRDVSSGELMVGDRIPPVRALASELGLSAGTVAKAYREMETHGVIETRGRKGTFIAQGRDDRDAAAARAHAAALHDAGLLSIRAIGSDWTMQQSDEGTTLDTAAGPLTFEVFVDARGQKPLEADDLPFPTLRASLLAAGVDVLDVDEDYRLLGAPAYDARVYMGAIPYLMHDRPFVQGITAACDIGTQIGAAVLEEAAASGRRRRRIWSGEHRPRLRHGPAEAARTAEPAV